MRTAIVFWAATAIAAANDPSAEARYRAKYGRPSPAAEAREAASKQARRDAAKHAAKHCDCDGCRRTQAQPSASADAKPKATDRKAGSSDAVERQ
jgi:hypothetical protein